MKNSKLVLELSLSSKDFFWRPVQRADLLANIELVAFHPHSAIIFLQWCKSIAYEGLV